MGLQLRTIPSIPKSVWQWWLVVRQLFAIKADRHLRFKQPERDPLVYLAWNFVLALVRRNEDSADVVARSIKRQQNRSWRVNEKSLLKYEIEQQKLFLVFLNFLIIMPK